ncbi:acyltransferase family protein [Pseudanabaena sp. FACHB-2040]|uniref:acyltransferase family protein n=1 Tax=Pseudanabaena sp. FACHB-2040 TaxID=2692859 RepID=UPI0016886857|nr:acyltransferase family protein [Pseudanabaena sp. FACHB-2040]
MPPPETFSDSAAFLVSQYLKAAATPNNTLTGWSLEDRDPHVIEKLLPFFGGVYRHYFRVKTDGWEHIPAEGKVLLIGSHNGGWAAPDTVMMAYDWFRHFGTERPIYAQMESRMWRVWPALARLATQVGALRAHPQTALAALRQNASLLIYPGGLKDVFRPHALRHKIHFGGHQGFIKLALQEAVPIVPLISYGAHSTLFILADVYPVLQRLHHRGIPWPWGIDPGTWPIYLGLPWGLALGPLPNIPLPVQLHTRICRPIFFDRYGDAAAHDKAYVDECYHRVTRLMQLELDRLVEEEKGQQNDD